MIKRLIELDELLKNIRANITDVIAKADLLGELSPHSAPLIYIQKHTSYVDAVTESSMYNVTKVFKVKSRIRLFMNEFDELPKGMQEAGMFSQTAEFCEKQLANIEKTFKLRHAYEELVTMHENVIREHRETYSALTQDQRAKYEASKIHQSKVNIEDVDNMKKIVDSIK